MKVARLYTECRARKKKFDCILLLHYNILHLVKDTVGLIKKLYTQTLIGSMILALFVTGHNVLSHLCVCVHIHMQYIYSFLFLHFACDLQPV